MTEHDGSPGSAESPVHYLSDGGIAVDPKAMQVGHPYLFDLGGERHVAVKSDSGSVDFYVLPPGVPGVVD